MKGFLGLLIVAPFGAIIMFVMGLPALILRSLTISYMWFWLLVPQGLPILSWVQVLFGLLLYETVVFKVVSKTNEQKENEPGYIGTLLVIAFVCGVQLLSAYLLSLWFY